MPVLDVKESIRERDGYRCVDCGRTQRGRRLDVHRLVPGRLGGRYTPENCVTLCRKCHRARHKKYKVPHHRLHLSEGWANVLANLARKRGTTPARCLMMLMAEESQRLGVEHPAFPWDSDPDYRN